MPCRRSPFWRGWQNAIAFDLDKKYKRVLSGVGREGAIAKDERKEYP
ncbi:MAG TPA: hypothetical protein V6D43_19330 [Candidatus Sericytochromatia bacterium]